MKKIIAILLAAAMLAGTGLAALAEAVSSESMAIVEDEVNENYEEDEAAEPDAPEEGDPEVPSEMVGAWYGEIYGMSVELKLTEEATYALTIAGRTETRLGRWLEEGDLIFLDPTAENRVILHEMDEGELEADIEGIPVTLRRELPATFDAALKEGVVMADFEGHWVCTRVGVDGMVVPAAPEGKRSPLTMDVAGESIVLTGTGSEDAPITVQSTYGNGVMTLDLGGDAGNEGPVMRCLIQPLANGGLRLDVNLGEEFGAMSYFLERKTEALEEDEGEDIDEGEDEEDVDAEDEDEEDIDDEDKDLDEGEEEEDVDEEDEVTEPEATEEPAAATTPEGRITSIIESRVKSKFSFTKIDGITINSDGEAYSADVSLTWEQPSPGDTAKTVLGKFSADLAAYVGQRCPEVNDITVNWTVPSLDGASATARFNRGEDGMEEGESQWDSAFGG